MTDWVCSPVPEREVCGGKLAALAALSAAGLRTPRGFVVTTAAFGRVAAATGLAELLDAIAATTPPGPARLADIDSAAGELVRAAPWPAGLRDALATAHAELVDRTGTAVLVVRSSATWEGTPTASAAGQLRSVLGVTDGDGLSRAIREVWASAFSPAAVAYRQWAGLPLDSPPVAVGVQELVTAPFSGVACSAHPVTGDPATVVIETVYGLCGPLVDGVVTPEHLELGRDGTPRRRRAARQHLASGYDPVRRRVTERTVTTPVRLRPDQRDAVLRGLLRAEAVFGRPVEIEWGWLPTVGLVVLQARPVTALVR